MANLSREDFIRIFGFDPNTDQPSGRTVRAAALKNTSKPQTSAERATSEGGSFVDTAKLALDVAANAIPAFLRSPDNPEQAVAKSVTEDYTPSRVADNAVAGVLATPGAVGGAIDLARFGAPALVEGVLSDDDKAVTSRIADAFMERIMPPEVQDQLADKQTAALEQFVSANPDASADDIKKFHKQYIESDDFHNEVINSLPLGLRLAQQNQGLANEAVGLQRPDGMTAADEAMQIVGSSFLGLPASTVQRLTKPVVNAVGERVARSIPARVAARTVEMVTPMTLPLTPGNVALNAGVGVGINEAIRGMTGQDTLVNYNDFYNPDKNPSPTEIGSALGVTSGILFGLPGVSRNLAKAATEATEDAVKFVGQQAGETLEQQSSQMTKQISGARGLLDQNAPVKAAAQKFKSADDTETVPLLDAVMSSGSNANRVEVTNNALNYGILDEMPNTVPFVKLEEAFNQLDDTGKDMLDKYIYATQRASNERIYEKSLMSQIEDARNKVIIAQTSGHKGRINAANKEFSDLQMRYRQLQDDDPSTRSLMRDWTRAEVQQYIQAGNTNPQIKQMADAMRKVSGDLVTYMNKNGLIDDATAKQWKGQRDLHVKVQERPYADKGALTRRAMLFRDKFKPVGVDSEQPLFINTASRNVTGEGAVVNRPLPGIAALKESVIDTVRNVAVNNTRREVVDRLAALPNARGTLLRPHEFDVGNGRKVSQITQAQYDKLYPKGIKNEDDYIKIYRDGKLELWQFADPMITKSLQFAPVATVPILNSTRKIFQQMTTGVAAPWFAARAFMWDVPVAQTTKNAGRSLGLMDTFARRLFMNTSLEKPVGALFDRVFDPTSVIAAAAGIPTQLGLRAAKAVGDKIGDDLARHSGVFNAIASSGPTGQRYVQAIGEVMARTFDESALAVMSRNMSTSMSHLNDVSRVRNDYASAASKVTGPFRAVFDGYKAMLDSVHMSTRYAFFANNYGLLKARYGNDIPKNELRKLVQETRNLTGDMSRQSLSPTIQKITSIVPYSNAMIQGTRHILSSAVPSTAADAINTVGGNIIRDKDNRFWSQFLTGIAIPSFGALSALSQWDGAEDYWYNKVPKWKQMSGIPVPDASVLLEYAQTGQWPQFDPKKLNIVPLAPELSMILAPVTAAARAMGIIGSVPSTVPQPFMQQIKDTMDQITSFSTPPIAGALLATSGNRLDLHSLLTGQGGISPINPAGSGANADMMTSSSSIPQAVYDTLGALLGSAAQLAMQSMNVFDISMKESDDFVHAANEAFDTAEFEFKRRLPEVSTGLWDARPRQYANSPESEYVYKTERELEPIIGSDRQLSIERDTKNRVGLAEELGLDAPNKVKDKNLNGLMSVVWDTLRKKGPYKQATDQYSQARKLLKDLENSRARMPDEKYNEARNRIIMQQQELIRTKSQVLQSLERQLTKQIGRQFEAQYGLPFSFDNLSKAVRKDVEQ